jgi:hypothetical protein
MRGAGKVEFLYENDSFVGVHLDANFCAEHEWGIKDLHSLFGITAPDVGNGSLGLGARRIQRIPRSLFFGKDTNSAILASISTSWHIGKSYKEIRKRLGLFEHAKRADTKLAGAWDSGDFAVVAATLEGIQLLEELYEAISKKDAVILYRRQVFNINSGLTIAIASELYEKYNDAWEQADIDQYNLMNAFEATGIEEKLRKSNKKYYALSPRWANAEKTELEFWLNPYNQTNNRAGWYSLQDLKEWIHDEGPIPKKNPEKKRKAPIQIKMRKDTCEKET